ncbi:MAG: hypothetical protein MJ101_05675 [Clostridia bacterium]|nr:hypothetical protein [Clostridia bacterium]
MKIKIIVSLIMAITLVTCLSACVCAADQYDPVRQDSVAVQIVKTELIILAISCVIGLLVILAMKSKHAPPKQNTTAGGNLKGKSFVLLSHRDMFMYSTTTRTPRQTQQNSGRRPR